MKKISILLVMIMAAFAVNAQVAINKDGTAPDANSILHVKSNPGGQFLFYDSDATMRLQSYQSGDTYDGNAYIDFGNSNGGYHSVGKIGKIHNNANLSIQSDIGLFFSFSSGSSHRMTGTGLALGKTVPTQMLDVAGNAAVSGTFYSVGDITTDGDLWGTNGYLTSNLEVGGNGTFSDQVGIGGGTASSTYIQLNLTGTAAGIDFIGTDGGNTYRFVNASNGNFYLHGTGGAAVSSILTIMPNGNITTIADLTSGGNITATGDVTANGDLWGTNGNLTNDLAVGGDGEFTGRIGIGTAPLAALHIKATSTAINSGIRLETSGASGEDWYAYMNANDDLIFRNDGLDLVKFSKDNGNVNIEGEMNRTAQGDAHLLPIAYGVVNSDGTISNAGTGNWSSSWNGSVYEISITGEAFYYADYIVNITNIGGPAMSASYGSVSNNLTVSPKNSSGTVVQDNFSFVVYKP